MTTPKTVERQLQEAEALQQALSSQAQAAAANVITDVAQLEAPAPAPAPAATSPAPAPTVQAPAPAPSDDWQHRFKTLQGMYNADAARFQATLKQYESQINGLVQKVEAVSQAATKANEPPKGPKADPQDEARFGEDTVEMVTRYASRAFEQMREEFGSYAASLDARLKALEDKVLGVSERTAKTMEEMFYQSLGDQVPDWRQINEMDSWLNWLGREDEVYGMTRQQALDNAHAALNANRVAAVFKKFKDDVLAKQPTLENQVAPAAGAASAPPPPSAAAPRVITQKAVQDFYLALAKGRYRGKEAEAERLKQEIDRAAAEGRIV